MLAGARGPPKLNLETEPRRNARGRFPASPRKVEL